MDTYAPWLRLLTVGVQSVQEAGGDLTRHPILHSLDLDVRERRPQLLDHLLAVGPVDGAERRVARGQRVAETEDTELGPGHVCRTFCCVASAKKMARLIFTGRAVLGRLWGARGTRSAGKVVIPRLPGLEPIEAKLSLVICSELRHRWGNSTARLVVRRDSSTSMEASHSTEHGCPNSCVSSSFSTPPSPPSSIPRPRTPKSLDRVHSLAVLPPPTLCCDWKAWRDKTQGTEKRG